MKIDRVFKSYVGGVHMGEPPAPAWPRTELTTGLAEVSRINHWYFQVCFAVLLPAWSVDLVPSDLITRLAK